MLSLCFSGGRTCPSPSARQAVVESKIRNRATLVKEFPPLQFFGSPQVYTVVTEMFDVDVYGALSSSDFPFIQVRNLRSTFALGNQSFVE
jgi:hypothetical protein